MPLPRSSWGISAQHPFLQLIYLFTICLGLGTVIFTIYMGVLLLGGQAEDLAIDPITIEVGTLRVLQGMTSLAFFIIPGVVFTLIYHKKRFSIFNSRPIDFQILLISVALVVVALPLVYLSYTINQSLVLPEALSSMQAWIEEQELKAAEILERLTEGKSIGVLISNLIVLALLPAVGEELIFRGFMQRIFLSWTRSAHVAIFITAVLFSAMHLQFMGFLPRFFLGLLLGYLYFYSRNLTAAMIGHFCFNAISVIAAFLSQDQEIENLGEDGSWPLYFFSGLLFVVLFMALYRIYRKDQDIDKPISFNSFMAEHFGNKETASSKSESWHCIYKTSLPYQAELVKSLLIEKDIEAVVLNQRDSAYNTFGDLEVYVHPFQIEAAREILIQAGMETL